MTDKERVEKAIDRIEQECIENVRTDANRVYKDMACESLHEIAEEITDYINLICDLRNILEREE